MLGILILLFVTVPVLELMLLLRIGSWLGVLPTILLVLTTGVVGASLARSQGLAVLTGIRREMAAGRAPIASLVDGALILAAGLLLLTPGVLTDAFGLALLLPPVRALVRRGLAARMQRMIEAGRAQFTIVGGPVTPRHDRPAGRDVTDL